MLTLHRISTCWKPEGQAGGCWLYGNGRLLSACLWHVVISQITKIVKGRWQPVNAHGKVYYALPWFVVYVHYCMYIASHKWDWYIPCVGFQRCTLKDDISYLLPTWLSAGTGKLKRKHHFIGWQERTNKMKNKSCATNFATQQPFSLLLLLQEPFLLAERKKMCYLSMAANQTNTQI